MAQVKLLKIASDGVPLEFSSTDDITLNSFTAGAGPVMSPTGIDMNGQDVTDLSDLVFTDPAVGTVNQTAGALIINNIMAKERSNTLTTAADILFPVITDTAGQVDALRLPAIAGTPTATPTATGEGFLVWDSTNNYPYIWNGSSWVNISAVGAATSVANIYTADTGGVAARDVVYISSADSVTPALASSGAPSRAVGFAEATVAATNPVNVKTDGIMGGFSGLTVGARYYLDASTAGAITDTIPTGTGNTIVQTGYAKSATDFQIQLLQLGRRA